MTNPTLVAKKYFVFDISKISVALPRKQELNKQPQFQKNTI